MPGLPHGRDAHRSHRTPQRAGHREQGFLTAIEAAVVGLMLVTSLAFLAALDPHRPRVSTPTREPVEVLVGDLLASLEAIPTGDAYQSQMQRAIAKAMQGNTTYLESLIDRTLPPGTECRLFLDNGHDTRQIAGPSERLARESVSQARLWRPTWSYALLAPSLDVVSNLHTLQLEGYAVSQGSLVKEQGVPVEVTVNTTLGLYTAGAVMALRDAPTASMYLLNETNQPSFNATSQESNWTLVVRAEPGLALPEGTLLNITLPSGVSEHGQTLTSQSGWRNILAAGNQTKGSYVRAELSAALSDATLNFTFHARPGGDALHIAQASLSNGTSGTASLVLGKPGATTSSVNPVQQGLYVTAPKPMSPASTATWGVVLALPSSTTGQAVVNRLDVRADGDVFEAVQGLHPTGALDQWLRVAPGHLQWRGARALDYNAALSFTFRVTAANKTTSDEPALKLPLSFGTHNFTLGEKSKPHVFRASIPPPEDLLGNAQPGYALPIPLGESRNNATVKVDWVQRGMPVRGNASYGVTTWQQLSSVQEALRSGLARSNLDLSRGKVRIGEEFNVTVDFQGLLDEVNALSTSISGWNVEVFVYDPAQPFVAFKDMRPSFHGKFGSNGSLNFTPDTPNLRAIEAWNVNPGGVNVTTSAYANIQLNPPDGAFYGPHAVVAQANFFVNDLLGNTLLQSARRLAVIDVVPDSGQSESALYWAVMECWLPDW